MTRDLVSESLEGEKCRDEFQGVDVIVLINSPIMEVEAGIVYGV